MAAKEEKKYLVIRAGNEQKPWTFAPSKNCLGTDVRPLPTADYTLLGYEKSFVIERKGSVGEFYKNVFEDRFTRELGRMEAFEHPFVILEFTVADLVNFPAYSGIPKSKWPQLRANGRMLLMRFWEIQLAFKSKIIFAGRSHGQEIASSLFKRIVENVQPDS